MKIKNCHYENYKVEKKRKTSNKKKMTRTMKIKKILLCSTEISVISKFIWYCMFYQLNYMHCVLSRLLNLFHITFLQNKRTWGAVAIKQIRIIRELHTNKSFLVNVSIHRKLNYVCHDKRCLCYHLFLNGLSFLFSLGIQQRSSNHQQFYSLWQSFIDV